MRPILVAFAVLAFALPALAQARAGCSSSSTARLRPGRRARRCASRPSLDEAAAMMARDPAVTSGMFTGELHAWTPAFRSDQPLPH